MSQHSLGQRIPLFPWKWVRAPRPRGGDLPQELGRVEHHLHIYSKVGSKMILPTNSYAGYQMVSGCRIAKQHNLLDEDMDFDAPPRP